MKGRVTQIIQEWPWVSPDPPSDWTPDTTYNKYDVAGNVRYSGWRHTLAAEEPQNVSLDVRAAAGFVGADGKLMVQQTYNENINYFGAHSNKRGAYEEYWYDALGRRVLVRRRTDALCTGSADCASTIERLVWDGDQILYELRAPGGDTLTTTQLNATPTYTGADHEQYGVVAYTHGPGIDAPLDVIRMEYGTWGDVELTVVPHTNWRGEYGAGSDTTGTVLTNIDFQWPADFRGAFHGDPGGRGLPEWFGSLIQDKRDMSGLMYMRNRYYDPATGRFTQEDPIGLAGGLNLYGFADGDPVNFSDPFGLKVCFSGEDYEELAENTRWATGTTFDLDDRHCATNVRPSGDNWTEVSEGFATLAADENYMVELVYDGGGSRIADGKVRIDRSDIGARYGTYLDRPGRCVTSRGAAWDQPSIIAHELGHVNAGWLGHPNGGRSNRMAITWENTVHGARGRPLRHLSCH
jgi:RHS repeat-associated protein